MTKLTIGFAGTPEFAVPCLQALHASEHAIKVIFTQPDRPAGRGQKLQPSAVKQWAQAHAIPIEQPLDFKATDRLAQLQALNLDVLVVIAYGLILPPRVLRTPRYGCINVHASMLPRWRGASPIQHALLFGDPTSGITIMQMDNGMDTGNILLQRPYRIKPFETAASLHNALALLAPEALMTILNTLPNCLTAAQAQAPFDATYAPKIQKQDAAIHWQDTAEQLERKIRAFNPWPIAYCQSGAQLIRIYAAHTTVHPSKFPPGTVVHLSQDGLVVATGSVDLCITQLQFAGGKILSVNAWANSARLPFSVGSLLQ